MTVMLDNWSTPYQQGEPFYGRSNWTDRSTTVPLKHGDNRAGAVAARPPLFSGILAEDYARIAAAARVKEFVRGEMLYIGGDSVSQVLLLTSGFAKISQFGLSGMEVILRLSVPGDVLGAMGLFTTGLHFTTAQAFRMCRALVWDAPTFRALVTRYPVLHQNMVKILSEDLLELQERFREVATERVAPRVARQLVRLLKRIGRSVNGAVEVSLTREELAQMTGTTLFTVSRLLSAWEERGMVKPRREGVTICDVPLLRAMSEES
jgi:CRP/FNR family transcriptional regulator, nitrogen oxide reductase regulator